MTPASVARALGFLTRLPVPARFFGAGQVALSDDAGSFALAGALIAVPGAVLLLIGAVFGAPPLMMAGIAVLATIALTGALHEDGLADTADGFGGGATGERRMDIMRDSAIGTYGVLAVIASVLLQVTALGALAETGVIQAAFAFVAAHTASRAAMVWHWSKTPPARTDGVAAASGQPPTTAVNAVLVGAGIVLALAAILATGVVVTALAAVAVSAATAGFSRLSGRLIGGHTGDTIGATEQIARSVMLVGLAMAA
ncbi:MAG: adenosylcobinamide-GDP ribazoletransferase [Roseitalea sp.]|jgi:adenosylcobinamide-GDP ribazoletransferase|uniref:Adenosylcobinamide-GDP ribazoletransferase n=1 Tax=Effrenium voratum TaxID=2562239 RepID=A0AA36N1I1_9DINO|nr:adenosylcobinamide-GDP ribazoletransferase [Oceaniradius stylonematis]MBO6552616.1 adenosylcobinamide-GDP ribazoletransferase [Roseitalea sp.]MBO6950464.1 adenosylcobinamide-GDP ribazoletransferase [Rhizobiaceae bacterium]CAJ1391121.1 unnamed protein product [Effrenium voratum]MBO6591549.1 adenosylcobinamide-GDP ribazoletransferase [Roseitalea sp.]MBO6599404.1 adenosylcobinamide-GDP ribazoletransferase [Roseitalea sp.]